MKCSARLILFILLVNLFSLGTARADNPHEVTLDIKEIKSKKGQFIIAIFKDEEGFKNSKPVKRLHFEKANIANGRCTINLPLEPGTWGISILDDENKSDKMDFNMVGMPKEGFGFSNYYHTGMSRPKFSDFKMEIKSGQKIEMRMKYY